MKVIAFILVLILALIIIIFLVKTGGFSGLSFKNAGNNFKFPSLFPTSSSSGSGSSMRSNPSWVPTEPASGTSSGASATSTIDPSQIPKGFTVDQLSPFFHKIRFGSVFPGFGAGSVGQVSLLASLDQNESVDVTGWYMKANRGSQYIPQAIPIYDPSGLSAETDIYLQNGQQLSIYSSASKISRNFRLNKCIGYLEQTQGQFNPPLGRSCPYIDRSEIQNFTGACQNYILSLGNCAIPNSNPPIPFSDYGCQSFLSKLNYGGCFARHRGDADFLDREWRVWTGVTFLDQSHDSVMLFDMKGLLVDEYDY